MNRCNGMFTDNRSGRAYLGRMAAACRILTHLLCSGLPAHEALDAAAGALGRSRAGKALAAAADAFGSGRMSFGEALGAAAPSLDPFFVAVVRDAETGLGFDRAFEGLADFYRASVDACDSARHSPSARPWAVLCGGSAVLVAAGAPAWAVLAAIALCGVLFLTCGSAWSRDLASARTLRAAALCWERGMVPEKLGSAVECWCGRSRGARSLVVEIAAIGSGTWSDRTRLRDPLLAGIVRTVAKGGDVTAFRTGAGLIESRAHARCW